MSAWGKLGKWLGLDNDDYRNTRAIIWPAKKKGMALAEWLMAEIEKLGEAKANELLARLMMLVNARWRKDD